MRITAIVGTIRQADKHGPASMRDMPARARRAARQIVVLGGCMLMSASAAIAAGPSWLDGLFSPAKPVQLAQSRGNDASAPVIGRSEWNQPFDTSQPSEIQLSAGSNHALLSPETIPAIEQAIARYEYILASGGWPQVPSGAPLKIGMKDARVIALRQRLAASGDLAQSLGDPSTFDSYVETAVRRFQARNGLREDGVVRDETLSALNVPPADRLQQLRANLERMKEFIKEFGRKGPPPRFVMVNIPAAEIEAVDNQIVVSRHTAIVGKPERPTPLIVSKIHELNFNPFWHVPQSIVERDVIPAMQRDPEYLNKNLIRAYDKDENVVDTKMIDWNSDEPLLYQYRQDPGEDINSLGAVKLNFSNKHAVFLHDTPQKRLFGQNYRAYSSGCVRVQNVEQLITWLLQGNTDEDWSGRRVDAVIRSGERIDVAIKDPVPLYLIYVTAWATPEGIVNFRRDLYERDGVGPLAASY